MITRCVPDLYVQTDRSTSRTTSQVLLTDADGTPLE